MEYRGFGQNSLNSHVANQGILQNSLIPHFVYEGIRLPFRKSNGLTTFEGDFYFFHHSPDSSYHSNGRPVKMHDIRQNRPISVLCTDVGRNCLISCILKRRKKEIKIPPDHGGRSPDEEVGGQLQRVAWVTRVHGNASIFPG